MLDTGCWILDTGCWILDTGCWMLDAGCWILDAGCWIRDSARFSLIQHQESSIQHHPLFHATTPPCHRDVVPDLHPVFLHVRRPIHDGDADSLGRSRIGPAYLAGRTGGLVATR